MEFAKLDKILDDHKTWLRTNREEGTRADLTGANLRDANMDFSAFPLWCGGLNVHIDDRLATQMLYHIVRNVLYSKNTSAEMKEICKTEAIVQKANKFHRVNECGEIVIENEEEE